MNVVYILSLMHGNKATFALCALIVQIPNRAKPCQIFLYYVPVCSKVNLFLGSRLRSLAGFIIWLRILGMLAREMKLDIGK